MEIKESLNTGFQQLGFDKEVGGNLILCSSISEISNLSIKFHLEKAKNFKADGVFFRKELESFKPQVYIFDYTEGISFNEKELTEIHKKVWSSGIVPIICVFYDTEIKIIDCTTHIKNDKPAYLVDYLSTSINAHKLYNEQFAIKIKTGAFWEEEENKKKFKFNNSAYDILIKWIKELKNEYNITFQKDLSIQTYTFEEKDKILNKVIVQSILIKYLEERQDENGKRLFHDKYFNEFENATTFTDVLNNTSHFIELLGKLHKDFNGNLFEWNSNEKRILQSLNLSLLASALGGYDNPNFKNQLALKLIRYYEFSYVPVELISRLYEEFLGEDKQEKGLYYTPAHLAKLLIDEAMPLKNYDKVQLKSFKLLDPACGSGIFLVLGFKRLVQWWRLQNQLAKPTPDILKELLSNIFGTDKEEQATRLAAFSLCLALCDELSPMQIIDDLKFDDLTSTNVLYTDFFIEELNDVSEKDKSDYESQKLNFENIKNIKFDLVIGNPPFDRGAISDYTDYWKTKKIKIPQGQIALKFLANTFDNLKEDGLQCLIIKSSGLLYNSTSDEYKKILFKDYNVLQILDFTALARNKSLWDNGADVASAAIFTRKQAPNFDKNILHLTFRRTKPTKERIFFEIDEYDLHFINRDEAIQNPYIWKINLLGGGRIKTIVSKTSGLDSFKTFLQNNNCYIKEGHGTLKNVVENSTQISKRLFSKGGIDSDEIKYEIINDDERKRIKDDSVYYAPNILISETLDLECGKLKFIYNNKYDIIFKNRFVGIACKDKEFLLSISKNLETYNSFYLFYSLISSAQVLINLNTSVMAYDIYNLPFLTKSVDLDVIDRNVIQDVTKYYQKFLRHGETSKAIKPIIKDNFKKTLLNFGENFIEVLNPLYKLEDRKYRLSDVVSLFDNTYIACVFKYDNNTIETQFHVDENSLDIEELATNNISKHLSSKRIIKLYNIKDTIVFIKPNQQRYWLSLIAIRDADKSLVALSKAGY